MADVFLYFQKEIGELEPDYDDCGNFCPTENNYKDGFCANCPKALAKKNFKKSALEQLAANPKTKIHVDEFENLYNTLIGIIGMTETSPERISYRTSFFIDAWKAAKDSSDRMDEFKRRQNQPK